MKGRLRSVGMVLAGAVVLAGLAVALLGLRRPSAERAWAPDQAETATIVLEPDRVRIRGLRDFRYAAEGAVRPAYRDEDVALADVQRVWFALAPFADKYRGLAHSFLSFELEGGRFVAVSVEARREEDERYSLLGGVTRSFELVYVVGTEEDLLGVRALRGDTLFLYPSVATPDQARAIFLDMMIRAKGTQERPEFYNTVLNNCATNLRLHVNRATGARLPWGWGILLPGFSDALALEHGLLATALPVQAARARYRVDHRVREALAGGGMDFSRRIRAGAGE